MDSHKRLYLALGLLPSMLPAFGQSVARIPGRSKCKYELRTKVRLGGPIGEYIGFWGGPIKEYTRTLVQGSSGNGGL